MGSKTTFKSGGDVSAAKSSVPRAVPKNPDRVTKDTDFEPIALYNKLNNRPYSSVYFEIDHFGDMNESLQDDLNLIDKAYQGRVVKGTYEDSKDTFKIMIKEAEQVTDTKNTNHNIKIAKIAEYLRFIDKLKKIEVQQDRWRG